VRTGVLVRYEQTVRERAAGPRPGGRRMRRVCTGTLVQHEQPVEAGEEHGDYVPVCQHCMSKRFAVPRMER
jgi:hypothetical protein